MQVEGLQLESSRQFCSFGFKVPVVFGIAGFLSGGLQALFRVVKTMAPLWGILCTATSGTLRHIFGSNETREIYPHMVGIILEDCRAKGFLKIKGLFLLVISPEVLFEVQPYLQNPSAPASEFLAKYFCGHWQFP